MKSRLSCVATTAVVVALAAAVAGQTTEPPQATQAAQTGQTPQTAPPPAPTRPNPATAPPATRPAVGPTAPPGYAPAPLEQGVYRIGPEDVLDIAVWKNDQLTKTVAVRPDGRISLPLVNDVQAANLTPMQLRDQLTKGLTAYIAEPEVSVVVKEIHSLAISVVGAVKKPGRFELKGQATVLEALALAEGLTDFAKRDRIVIYRREGTGWKTIEFSYSKVVNDWDVKQNFLLMPGDIVVVP